MNGYEMIELTDAERDELARTYDGLQALASCRVPSVRAAARSAAALIAQAMNGQGLGYELYTAEWEQ